MATNSAVGDLKREAFQHHGRGLAEGLDDIFGGEAHFSPLRFEEYQWAPFGWRPGRGGSPANSPERKAKRKPDT